MNWEAIGVVAEVVGAAGVIITLGYVAIQIHHGNAIARVGAFRDYHQDIGLVSLEIAKDSDLHRIWYSGLFSDDQLSAEEQDRLGLLLFQLFGALNAGYQSSWLRSSLDEYIETLTDAYIAYPHIQGWWSRQRRLQPEPFRSYVDTRLLKIVGDTEHHA